MDTVSAMLHCLLNLANTFFPRLAGEKSVLLTGKSLELVLTARRHILIKS